MTIEIENLIQRLRRKEGNWVEWGQACQSLQKSGYSPQRIFEETGFEPIQQNQIIVGFQVYTTIVNNGVSESTRSHFTNKGSDVLYELRILSGSERSSAAEFVLTKKLDVDQARELAKAIKDFSYLRPTPAGFSDHPGDCLAYLYWKRAKQISDLQERSRLIAQGLRFVQTESAREQIENLLTDFTVLPKRPAPTLPIYRLESEAELPRILPVVGEMPITRADLKVVPVIEATNAFGMVKFSGTGAWVPIPGWQIVLNAEDPVVIIANSDRLPGKISGYVEDVLVIVDRAIRVWESNSYFIIEEGENLEFQWFEEEPAIELLGKVLTIVRPKRILDEELNKDVWQIDE